MAVPKKRTNKSKRNMRRSHHAKKPLQLTTCEKCKQPARPHTACANCGTYRNQEVIDVMKKLDKKEKKRKAQELEEARS